MDQEIAIRVDHVSKTFRIPHERVSSLRGAFVSALHHNTSYETFRALDDVSFAVKKGEFFGIIGRNGSGKSTLLKILAGIYHPDTGHVHTQGLISPFLELGIGFNPELSGRDNVYLNATVLGLTQKEIDEKFDRIVAFSELERFIDQKLKNYSSGMQVRLAFSVSIHANRDILLMDEVLAVGDSNFQSKCLEEFARYRDLGRTVILVSHDIGTIQRYCDRALLLRNGKVITIGKADEVGNEYIHENISDEETRMTQAKAAVSEDGLEPVAETQKVAEITRVEFLDAQGTPKNVFQTGEDISIRVYFKHDNSINDLNFGVAIFNQENQYILGINTFEDKIKTNQYVAQGYFQVDYFSVPLKTNSYFIKAGISGNNDVTVLDFLDKSRESFKIFSADRHHGIVELDYRWN